MAAEKRPKGILKSSSSFDKDGHHDVSGNKQAKWDEMNILATFHPPDKDYGHIKIDEPPTPYNEDVLPDSMDEGSGDEKGLDPENLADRLKGSSGPRILDQEEESSDEDLNMTEEQRAKRNSFEQKRKLHYNEFQAVKLARQLLDEEEDEDEDDNGGAANSSEQPENEDEAGSSQQPDT